MLNTAKKLRSAPSSGNVTSTPMLSYGDTIPIVYGRSAVEGKIVWIAPNSSVASSPTFAMALCEGVIDAVHNVWANGILLGALDFTLHNGSEEQDVDPTMASYMMACPAYRGLAYIIIHKMSLAQFDGEIPIMHFEVERNLQAPDTICQKIKAINILPASGEFVYDTVIQTKSSAKTSHSYENLMGGNSTVNNNTLLQRADALIAMDQLQKTCPNIEWVSLTISWFSSGLDIASCDIYPAVEYRDSITTPNDWMVANIERKDAREISRDASGNLRFGGTPSDNSVLNCVLELKSRGYKIMVYPLLMVDMDGKPWRGHIGGDAANLSQFFDKYNDFIKHYADLLKDYADGFIVGSEMKGLTSIMLNGSFPAINHFIALADQVRSILKTGAILTYAADWSEYHSVDGWFNLDALWTSQSIDIVGIDAYFPLTEGPRPHNGFSKEQIIAGWSSGEGWDYYYQDGKKIYFNDAKYAWKNIEYWWSNQHINPDGATTSWQPSMKPIWFTEFGFASVDCCSNQPNKFYDPASSDGGIPRFSNGALDFGAQNIAISSTVEKWQNSNMVQKLFLWAWDARPYPYFPERLSTWADGTIWSHGHWVNGKINQCSLKMALLDIFKRLKQNTVIDTSQISSLVGGYTITNQVTALSIIGDMQLAYGFYMHESGSMGLVFSCNTSQTTQVIDHDTMIVANDKTHSFVLHKTYKPTCPDGITLHYTGREVGYNADVATVGSAYNALTLYTSAAFYKSEAESCANLALRTLQEHRTQIYFKLTLDRIHNLDQLNRILVDGCEWQTDSITIDSVAVTIEASGNGPKAAVQQPAIARFYAHKTAHTDSANRGCLSP